MPLLGVLKALKQKKQFHYIISFSFITLTAIVCFLFIDFIDYRVVALILLFVLSIIAMLFDIRPVLFSAIYSALVWNFFFITPIYTSSIDNSEDVLLFLMYFVIALLNAVLTSKIRKAKTKVRDEEEKLNAIQLYDTLLNSLSHELRTPIATIIGAVDTLKENRATLDQTTQVDLLNEIDKASIRLNRQVENLLNMSRLESGFIHLQYDWTDVEELIHSVMRIYQDEFLTHPIHFYPDTDLPFFKLDRGLIEQVLHNILHNAVQYTPEGSPIVIKLSYRQEFCVIEVTDSGAGFPKNKVNHVFDKFYRLPSSETGGTGLGLSIVKGFVEAHNGTVELLNLPKKGATFTITIPTEATMIKPEEDA